MGGRVAWCWGSGALWYCQPVYSMRYTQASESLNGFISKQRQMHQNRTSAGMRALLLALTTVAAVAVLAGLFSGLDFLPSGEDYDQTTYERPPPPPPAPPIDTPISDASNSGFTVDEDNVEVRSGPSTEFTVLGVVNRGQTFRPNGRNQEGDWLLFLWEGMDGWVHTQHLTVTGSDQIPVEAWPPPPPPLNLPSSSDAPPPDAPPPDSSTPGSSPGGPSGPPPSE